MRHASVPFVVLAMAAVLLLSAGCAPAAAPSPTAAPKPAPTTAPPKPAPTTAAPKPAPTAAAPKPAPTAAPAAKPAAKAVTFQGKTVTILVPYSPGGSADIMMRQFAPTFQKHLPGNPTVVIQNMPGADGIVGENWVYNVAPKDGTVIGQFSNPVFFHQLFNPEQARFDAAKLQWLGSVSEAQVTFVQKSLGVKDARGLIQSGQKIVMGDTGPSRSIPVQLFLSLLGMDYKAVFGFGSSGDLRAAIRRGEINMAQDSLSGYAAAVVPMIQEGVVIPIGQSGLIQAGKVARDPRLADLPTFGEALVTLKGEGVKTLVDYLSLEVMAYMSAIQRGWVYPPNVPQETVAAVREAMVRAMADQELRDGYKKSVGIDLIAMDARETQDAGDAILARFKSNPAVLERIRQLTLAGS